jgi:hypothetical protein
MSSRAVIIDGVTIWVEVDDETLPAAPGGAGARPGLVERGAVADRVRDIGADLRGLLGSITRPVREALEQAQPEEWSIELNLGFKGEAGIPCLTKGEANGSVKITAKWKRG